MPDPNAKSPEYLKMEDMWKLPSDLLGGTLTMRAAGEKWLPKGEAEEHALWTRRLNHTVLYNAYSDTVEKLTAKPFSKPVVINGEVPDRLEGIEYNADQAGRNLTNFAADLFADGVAYGLSHVLVDFPSAPRRETLEQERQMNLRPAFVHIKAQDLIGWRSEIQNGRPVLTQIRFKYRQVVEDGDYGEKVEECIKVWTQTEVITFKHKGKDNGWEEVDRVSHTFNGIPLVTFYTKRTGFMMAEPPMMNLAWENLQHWQSSSDQRNCLHVARRAILFGRGFTATEVKAGIKISVNNAVLSSNKDADLKYVDYGAQAIKAGKEDLERIEERMEVLGLEPLVERASAATATRSMIHEGRSMTTAQRWVRNIEEALMHAYEIAGLWVSMELSEDFNVDVTNDFSINIKAQTNVQHLLAARKAGEITRATFLKEIQRYGVLSSMVDIDDEINMLDQEMEEQGFGMELPDIPDDEDEQTDDE